MSARPVRLMAGHTEAVPHGLARAPVGMSVTFNRTTSIELGTRHDMPWRFTQQLCCLRNLGRHAGMVPTMTKFEITCRALRDLGIFMLGLAALTLTIHYLFI